MPTGSRPAPYWPALVVAIDHGHARGWVIDQLLQASMPTHHLHDVDECQAILWRASILTDPSPGRLGLAGATGNTDLHGDVEDLDSPEDLAPEDLAPEDVAPGDLLDGVHPPADAPTAVELDDLYGSTSPQPTAHDGTHNPAAMADVEHHPPAPLGTTYVPGLALALANHWAALVRDTAGPAGPDPAAIERGLQREIAWYEAGVTRDRLVHVNEPAASFYEAHYPRSWGQAHLTDRLGTDITADRRFRAGHAPAGWTHLVDHLRAHVISDHEMLTAGVATTARTGRLVDRFRDRVVLPITTADGTVLAFVGRRHPDRTDTDTDTGPKYLNTAATVLLHKGDQLYVAGHHHLIDGVTPVRVEGPFDAIAVTLATGSTHVGVAPLGTSLTDEQAAELATIVATTGRRPIIDTDADTAGVLAAGRDSWVLAQHRLDPHSARLPLGTDHADIPPPEAPPR